MSAIRKETTKKINIQIKQVEKQLRDARLDKKPVTDLENDLAKLYDEFEDVSEAFSEKTKEEKSGD